VFWLSAKAIETGDVGLQIGPMPISVPDIRDMEMGRPRIPLAKLVRKNSHTFLDLITLVFCKYIGFAYLLESIKAGVSIEPAEYLVGIKH
jgi:hypothetical protein